MRLTTVGSGTISLAAGRACAAHLVEAGEVRLLMDCGAGAAHRMAALGVDWWTLTHVAFTHFHLDHVSDFATLVYAWRYGRLPARSQPLTVIGPAGTRALLERLAGLYGAVVTAPGFPLEVRELAPDEAIELGTGVRLSARKVPHTPESVAYSVEHGRRRLVYTGDMGYDPGLAGWASGCDVLLCECSLPAPLAIPPHLTPEQCAALAAIARPRLLALTHLYPPVLDVDIVGIVRTRFAGDVAIVHDGWTTLREDMSCWS